MRVAHRQGNQVKSDKTLVPPAGKMYRKVDLGATPPEKFELPFEGKLSQDNRWVIMANLIPWDEFEEEYAQNLAEDIGANDLGLLNQARVKTEKIIDILYKPLKGKLEKKPKT